MASRQACLPSGLQAAHVGVNPDVFAALQAHKVQSTKCRVQSKESSTQNPERRV